MNATKRWTYHFISQLECLYCRTKKDVSLYWSDGRIVDVDLYSSEALKGMLETLDVWCPLHIGMYRNRVASEGRMAHKRDAAIVADMKSAAQIASRYDKYRTNNGQWTTKQELFEKVRTLPCEVCGQQTDDMVFYPHRKMRSLLFKSVSLQKVIEEMEKCTLVCGSCLKRIESLEIEPPRNTLCLDENFWATNVA